MNDQAKAALAKAASVYQNRANIKRRVATGEIRATDVVVANPPDCVNLTVFELLCAQPRWGRMRALRFLCHVKVSESLTVGGLTERQRRLIEAEWTAQESAPLARRAVAV